MIQLRNNNQHPEGFHFDLREVVDGAYDILTVHGWHGESVTTCIDILAGKFELRAPNSAITNEAGYYARSAAVAKDKTPLLRQYLFDRFKQAIGGTDN